jgi:hypothetical protein
VSDPQLIERGWSGLRIDHTSQIDAPGSLRIDAAGVGEVNTAFPGTECIYGRLDPSREAKLLQSHIQWPIAHSTRKGSPQLWRHGDAG